jgi:2-oxoglutarate ferredoxin oxidoreductase subunit alpha
MDVLLIAYGATTGASRAAAREARQRGIKAGVLQLITIWPFPEQQVAELAASVSRIVVIEMNYSGQIAGEVQKLIGTNVTIQKVNKYNGQIISPEEILAVL